MSFTDKTLQCRDCGNDFVFTVGEQEFYAEKGFTNEPGRCQDCRGKRRTQMRSGQREMHEATCAECGAETQVPFKPTNGRPVYCQSCFSNR
ncbi:MAG: zinc-binding protein [Firmicutes bacterium]|nr:zinc-binding protein [Bacillota bacterium]